MDSVSLSQTIAVALSKTEFTAQQSIVQLAQQLVARSQAEQPDTAVNFNQPDLFRANTEKGKLLSFKAKTADSLSVLTKAKSAIEFEESYLNSMKSKLQSLTPTSSSTERAAVADEFNTLFDDINAQADGATQIINYIPTNLIGNADIRNFKTDDLYAKVSTNSGSVFVEGQYLGADFTVEDSSGFLWHLDEAGQKFVQYASDGSGTPTGNEISTVGLTIDSYDPTTGAVTYGGSGSLSGTLNREGLGIVKSEYYNGFSTDADVQQAIADVDAALSTLGSQGSIIKA